MRTGVDSWASSKLVTKHADTHSISNRQVILFSIVFKFYWTC